jgi:hypothetical protein
MQVFQKKGNGSSYSPGTSRIFPNAFANYFNTYLSHLPSSSSSSIL